MSSEPSTITAGDSVDWSRGFSDYPASAGWTLTYTAVGPATFPIAASAAGDNFIVSASPTATAGWAPGVYVLSAAVTRGSERKTIWRGSLQILPNPAGDALAPTLARQTLDLIEAALLGRIPRGLENTTIDGQEITRIPLEALHRLRQKYRAEVMNEERAALAAAGIRRRSTIFIAFDA